MNHKELHTIQREIPEVMTLTTGGEEESKIGQAGDSFFATVRERIGHAEQDIQDTQLELYHFREEDGRTIIWPSDGFLRLLTVNDHMRASVLDRRDGFNFHQVNFAYYPSTLQNEKFEEVDAIITNYFDKVLTNLSFPDRARGIFSQHESYALYQPNMSQGERNVDEKPDNKIHILEIQESLVASVIMQDQGGKAEMSTTDYLTPKVRETINTLLQKLD